MKYLIDSDALISADRDFYCQEICPDFLNWLSIKNKESVLFSVEKVLDEVMKKEEVGTLPGWAKLQGESFFLKPDQNVLAAMTEIAIWVNAQDRLKQQAKFDYFSDKADQYLVGHAKAHGFCVVTNEESAPQSTKRLLIPDVCRPHHVRCINLKEFMKEMKPGFKLVL